MKRSEAIAYIERLSDAAEYECCCEDEDTAAHKEKLRNALLALGVTAEELQASL